MWLEPTVGAPPEEVDAVRPGPRESPTEDGRKEAFRNGGTRSQNCWARGARTFGSVRKHRARANYVIAALVKNGCGILPQLQGESFDRNLIVVRWRPKHAKTDGRKILVSGTLSI